MTVFSKLKQMTVSEVCFNTSTQCTRYIQQGLRVIVNVMLILTSTWDKVQPHEDARQRQSAVSHGWWFLLFLQVLQS